MIDAEIIRTKPEAVVTAAANKGYKLDLKELKKLMDKTRELQTKTEVLRAKRNQISAKLSKSRDDKTMQEAAELKANLNKLEGELKDFSPQLKEELFKMLAKKNARKV